MGLWTPYLTDTALWIDANDASSIMKSSGGITTILDPKDISSAFTKTHGTLTDSNTQNGNNLLVFNQALLQSNKPPSYWKWMHDGSENYSIFSIIRKTVTSPANTLLVTGGGGTLTHGIWYRLEPQAGSVGGVTQAVSFWATNGTNGYRALKYTATNTVPPNEFKLITTTTEISNATAANRANFRIDGALVTSTNFTNTNNSVSDSNPTSTLMIGNVPALSAGFVGDLAELLIVKNANFEMINRIEGYLAWKWGLESNLPANHPYKNEAPTAQFISGTVKKNGQSLAFTKIIITNTQNVSETIILTADINGYYESAISGNGDYLITAFDESGIAYRPLTHRIIINED